MGFVQVRLEVLAININNIAALVRAGQTSLNIGSKHLSLAKSRAAVTGGRNSNATPAQSPNVSRHPMNSVQIRADVGKFRHLLSTFLILLCFFANRHFSTFKGAQGFRFFFPLPHSKILAYVVAAGAAT